MKFKFAAVDDGYVEFVGTHDEATSFADDASSYLRVVPVPAETEIGQPLDLRALELEFKDLTREVITLPADKFAEFEEMLAADPRPDPKLADLFTRWIPQEKN